jgi:hypothetical protein
VVVNTRRNQNRSLCQLDFDDGQRILYTALYVALPSAVAGPGAHGLIDSRLTHGDNVGFSGQRILALATAMSQHAAPVVSARLDPDVQLLSKPYTQADLSSKIRQVLSRCR